MDLREQWDYIERVAEERLEHNKTSRHVNNDNIEVIGAAGEIAARRFLGLPEELHTDFDDGKDLVFKNKSVDVKATVMTPYLEHRYLQWPEWKPVKAEIILLTAVDRVAMIATVVGYATREEVIKSKVNKERQWPCHEVPVKDLHPAWMLVKPEAYHKFPSSYEAVP